MQLKFRVLRNTITPGFNNMQGYPPPLLIWEEDTGKKWRDPREKWNGQGQHPIQCEVGGSWGHGQGFEFGWLENCWCPPHRWEGGEREGRTLREGCCIVHDIEFSASLPWLGVWRSRAAHAPGWVWSCLCPPAGCQGYPGLNGLLRLPDYRLSSPGLLPALATTNSHFCVYLQICLLTLSLPLAPAAYSLHQSPCSVVFFPFSSCLRAGVPYFKKRKKT